MSQNELVTSQIAAGKWQGVIRTEDPTFGASACRLLLDGRELGTVRVAKAPAGQGGEEFWELEADIPAEAIDEGLVTFVILREGDDSPLASFSILAGEPLAPDIRVELDLLRAELDLLKRAFRRHMRRVGRG